MKMTKVDSLRKGRVGGEFERYRWAVGDRTKVVEVEAGFRGHQLRRRWWVSGADSLHSCGIYLATSPSLLVLALIVASVS